MTRRTDMLGTSQALQEARSGAGQAPLDISLDTLPPSLNNLYATIEIGEIEV